MSILYFYFYINFVWIGWGVHMPQAHVWRSVLFFTRVGSGFEVVSSGLTASTLTAKSSYWPHLLPSSPCFSLPPPPPSPARGSPSSWVVGLCYSSGRLKFVRVDLKRPNKNGERLGCVLVREGVCWKPQMERIALSAPFSSRLLI